MGLSIPDRWIWDFWLAQDGSDFHIYYLQAPRSLVDPDQRHWHTTIGHAVSTDLTNWETLPDALAPSSDRDDWDNYTVWTGSLISHAGLWYMLYTGGNREEGGLIQRIGLAISKDLINWNKYEGNPVLLLDPKRYEELDADLWHDQAWRDPWLMKAPGEVGFYAFITARTNHGSACERGVIALAISPDLLNWEVMDPVAQPGTYGHMEIPQVVSAGGLYYLLFSTTAEATLKERAQMAGKPALTGTHYMVSENPLGPYRELTNDFLIGDIAGSRYGGKLIETEEDEWMLLTMRHYDEKGEFIGELADPIPVVFDDGGIIEVSGC